MSRIDPTAYLHSSSVIEGDVVIGPGCVIGPFCYLRGPIVIGKETVLSAGVIIGEPAEHKTKQPMDGVIRIGDRNRLREYVVVQRGTGDRETTIENDCYIMDRTHVAHDVLIKSHVTISPHTVLGGHSHILSGATLGIGTVLHQFSTVGSYAMVGMASVITKDVPPFALVAGNPARFRRLNRHVFNSLEIKEGDIEVTERELQSSHPAVQSCLAEFKAHSRRAQISLAAVSA